MLRINVEVTYTDGGLRQIAELQIRNTTELAEISDYDWRLYQDGRCTDTGEVTGHPRSDGWEPLVQNVLSQITGIGQPEPAVVQGDAAFAGNHHLLESVISRSDVDLGRYLSFGGPPPEPHVWSALYKQNDDGEYHLVQTVVTGEQMTIPKEGNYLFASANSHDGFMTVIPALNGYTYQQPQNTTSLA